MCNVAISPNKSKVAITYGIWGLKFRVKIKIHPCVALSVSNSELSRQQMFNNANDTHPNSPSRVLILRKVLRRNNKYRCNNER
jgi:hypothetical protein